MYVLINIMKAYFYALLAISASNLLTCIVVGIWSHRRLQYENMVWVRHQMGDSATVSDTEREDMRGEVRYGAFTEHRGKHTARSHSL